MSKALLVDQFFKTNGTCSLTYSKTMFTIKCRGRVISTKSNDRSTWAYLIGGKHPEILVQVFKQNGVCSLTPCKTKFTIEFRGRVLVSNKSNDQREHISYDTKIDFDLVRTALFDSNERDSIVANTKCQCHVNPLNQTTGPSLHESFCVGASDKNNV